jgi:polyisoprenoid-binding protein YceI
MSRARWVLVAVAVLLVLVVGGPWLYINVIQDDPPERLSLEDVTTTTAADATDPTVARQGAEGDWTIGAGSLAGYRVKEVLFGQDTEAVGRTSDVTGSMTIDGTTLTAAAFEVDLTTVTSDESRRDGQFHGRIMDTATYPTASFTLSAPVELASVPAAGAATTVSVTGDLTVRDVTRSVTFDLAATRTADGIAVNGAIPVVFADYGIADPIFGPAKVQDHGEIEVLLVLTPSA